MTYCNNIILYPEYFGFEINPEQNVEWIQQMPRIRDEILDCIVYCYPDENSAKNGQKLGGSGFIAHMPSIIHPNISYSYIITNRHVANKCKFIRLNNNHNNGCDIITIEQWVHHVDCDDIAIAIIPLNLQKHKVKGISPNMFLTQEIIKQKYIGLGDEIYLVGRYSLHDGINKNLPSARFGNISMMPNEPIKHKSGIDMEAFLVEMRSRNGYSGSPAFIYSIPGIPRPPNYYSDFNSGFLYLLGIDFGHFDSYNPVLSGKKQVEDYVVNVSSGMTSIAPAWKILELLECEEFLLQRQHQDDLINRKNREEIGGLTLD